MSARGVRRPLVVAGLALGFGLGGLVDVVVLHLVLQWHHIVSGLLPPLTFSAFRTNVRWDGYLAGALWLVTAAGLGLLFRAGGRADVRWTRRSFVGSLLVGGGLFHVFDEVVNHRLVGSHHIYPPRTPLADLAFLGVGLAVTAVGLFLLATD